MLDDQRRGAVFRTKKIIPGCARESVSLSTTTAHKNQKTSKHKNHEKTRKHTRNTKNHRKNTINSKNTKQHTHWQG